MADLGSINVISAVRHDPMADTYVITIRAAYLIRQEDSQEEAARDKLLEIKNELAKRNVVI